MTTTGSLRHGLRDRTGAGLLVALLSGAALLLTPGTPAMAHNTLQAATPDRDARLASAPTQVTLRFLQRLDPDFTTIVLSDAGQRKVPTGVPAVEGTTVTVSIDQPLPNSSYTVAYRVVSVDGHPVQGSYRFTVADPAGPPPTPAAGPSSAPADPVAAAGDPNHGPPMPLLVAGVVVAATAGGAVVLLRRRRRRRHTPVPAAGAPERRRR